MLEKHLSFFTSENIIFGETERKEIPDVFISDDKKADNEPGSVWAW